MPLKSGTSDKAVSDNIAELIRSGKSPDVAAAIAYRKAGRYRKASDDGTEETPGADDRQIDWETGEQVAPTTGGGPLDGATPVTMDLGVGDVHMPGTAAFYAAGYSIDTGTDRPDDKSPSDPTSKRPASIVIVQDAGGRVACVSRPEPPHEMAFPGGHQEDGETAEQAGARELQEETGLRASRLELVATLQSPVDGRTVHAFRALEWTGNGYAAESDTRFEWLHPALLEAQSALYRSTVRSLMDAMTMRDDTAGSVEPQAPAQDDKTAKLARRKKRAKARLDPKADGKPKRRSISIRADLAPGGALHVRHMTFSDDGSQSIVQLSDGTLGLRDVRRITSGAEVDPAAAGVSLVGPATWQDGTPKKLVWVQLAETGAWKGHSAGPFEMSPATFSEIVRNFERRGLPIPFDYEHASEQDPTQGSVPQGGAPAPGWAHKLDNRGVGGLWGLVEWLDKARTQIQSGEYAFLSPAIRFGSRDSRSGEQVGARLTSVALTNQPFLTGLEQLRAAKDAAAMSALAAPLMMPGRFEAQPLLALQLSELADKLDDVLDALEDPEDLEETTTMTETTAVALKDAQDKAKALSEDLAKKDAEIVTLTAKVEAHGPLLTAKDEEIVKLGKQVEARDSVITAKDAEIKGLTDKAATLEGELKAFKDAEETRVVDDRFDTYKDKTRMSRDAFQALYRSDHALFDKEFPQVSVDQKHLMRNAVPTEPRPTVEQVEQQGQPMTIDGYAQQLMAEAKKDGKKLSLTEAQSQASAHIARLGRQQRAR